MSLEIRWTEPAWLSLAEVLDYTQLMFGERQAKKMRKQVMDGVRRIARSPQMSAVEPYSKKVGVEMRGYLVIPRIKIIYSVEGEAVNIEYIKNTFMSERTMLTRMGYFFD